MRTAAPGKILLALAVFAAAAENLPAAVVRVERADGGYRLLRDGAPYFVRGAAGCNSAPCASGTPGKIRAKCSISRRPAA
ncbi:MAG: hypothetical protein NTZ16_05840 [Verrucomicrobia bacterium]|nr:hypothetical protein [Verrucomicrobiota bacterium]